MKALATASILVCIVIFVAAVYGYCSNIVAFFLECGISSRKRVFVTIARIVGIVCIPIGAILGYWNPKL